MTADLIVKIGGRAAEDDSLNISLARELGALRQSALLHGGGASINEIQSRYGCQPRFESGLRQTAADEMPLVDMALSGKVNSHLVRLFRSAGINAWGLSGVDGGLIRAEAAGHSENHTGRVVSFDTRPLEILWENDFFPVVAPPAADASGRGMNINADEAALALASAVNARRLVFLSDVPGVLENGKVIENLTPETIAEKTASGVVTGGMIPKLNSALGALNSGVGAVHIGCYTQSGDLESILSGMSGTQISKEETK